MSNYYDTTHTDVQAIRFDLVRQRISFKADKGHPFLFNYRYGFQSKEDFQAAAESALACCGYGDSITCEVKYDDKATGHSSLPNTPVKSCLFKRQNDWRAEMMAHDFLLSAKVMTGFSKGTSPFMYAHAVRYDTVGSADAKGNSLGRIAAFIDRDGYCTGTLLFPDRLGASNQWVDKLDWLFKEKDDEDEFHLSFYKTSVSQLNIEAIIHKPSEWQEPEPTLDVPQPQPEYKWVKSKVPEKFDGYFHNIWNVRQDKQFDREYLLRLRHVGKDNKSQYTSLQFKDFNKWSDAWLSYCKMPHNKVIDLYVWHDPNSNIGLVKRVQFVDTSETVPNNYSPFEPIKKEAAESEVKSATINTGETDA